MFPVIPALLLILTLVPFTVPCPGSIVFVWSSEEDCAVAVDAAVADAVVVTDVAETAGLCDVWDFMTRSDRINPVLSPHLT